MCRESIGFACRCIDLDLVCIEIVLEISRSACGANCTMFGCSSIFYSRCTLYFIYSACL
jgi:hypothetical protein